MFGFAVLVDVCLTGTLVTVLLRSRTGFKRCVHDYGGIGIAANRDNLAYRTDSLIEVLIVYAINTGAYPHLYGWIALTSGSGACFRSFDEVIEIRRGNADYCN